MINQKLYRYAKALLAPYHPQKSDNIRAGYIWGLAAALTTKVIVAAGTVAFAKASDITPDAQLAMGMYMARSFFIPLASFLVLRR